MRVSAASLFMIMICALVGCSSIRSSGSGVPLVSGNWRIQQTNAGGEEFTGILSLEQRGSSFSGSVTWDHHQRAAIVKGIVGGGTDLESLISFVIEYDGGLQGKYYATLNSAGNELNDGASLVIKGGHDLGMWNARLIQE